MDVEPYPRPLMKFSVYWFVCVFDSYIITKATNYIFCFCACLLACLLDRRCVVSKAATGVHCVFVFVFLLIVPSTLDITQIY